MDARREEFVHALNEARAARHLSVRGAAKLAGVPAATMQGWLSGRHYPTPELRPTFQAFVERLDIPDDLTYRWWLSARRIAA